VCPEFKTAEESFMTKHHQGPSPHYRYEHYDSFGKLAARYPRRLDNSLSDAAR
jgi:hypothetical protein